MGKKKKFKEVQREPIDIFKAFRTAGAILFYGGAGIIGGVAVAEVAGPVYDRLNGEKVGQIETKSFFGKTIRQDVKIHNDGTYELGTKWILHK